MNPLPQRSRPQLLRFFDLYRAYRHWHYSRTDSVRLSWDILR